MQKALASVPGVRQADFNRGTRLAKVEFEPGKVDKEALLTALKDAGFSGTIK